MPSFAHCQAVRSLTWHNAANCLRFSSSGPVSRIVVLLDMSHRLPVAGRKIQNVFSEDIRPPANLPHWQAVPPRLTHGVVAQPQPPRISASVYMASAEISPAAASGCFCEPLIVQPPL